MMFVRRIIFVYPRRVSCFFSLNISVPRKTQYLDRLYCIKKKVRHFSKTSKSEQDIEEEFNAIEDDIGRKFQLKEILYSNNFGDKLLQQINEVNQPSEFLQLYHQNKHAYHVQHMVQTVILLWNYWRNNRNSTDLLPKPTEDFLRHLFTFIDDMNVNEITSCYLYLKKIETDWSHPTMQKLLSVAIGIVSYENHVSLSALSRLLVAINTNRQFYTFLVCKNILPHVLRAMETCTNAEEMRLVTICLYNLHQMLSTDTLTMFKQKTQEMIYSGALDKNCVKCILKILNFLNIPNWSQSNSELIRNLLLVISDNIDRLNPKEIEVIFKIYQSQLEPAAIGPKLLRASEKLLYSNPTPEMLSCVVQIIQPNKREDLINLMKTMLTNDGTFIDSENFHHFFQTLRALKISDIKLCNLYWTNVLKDVEENIQEIDDYRIVRYSHRYMHFNNNLGGTYRHTNFEKKISSLIMTDITQGLSKCIPSRFARLAPFVIAYGHTLDANSKLPDVIIDKIESMQNQFSIFDCFHLSRGIQIALEMRFRFNLSGNAAVQFVKMDKIFSDCAVRHLNSGLTLGDVSMIVRSLNNRKASRQTTLYQNAIDKYNHISNAALSSRLIRDITFNLSSTNHISTELFHQMFSYVTKNKDYITGDTVEKILFSAYNLGIGHIPQNTLDAAVAIIKRDFDYMTGLSIVQSCLTLCFYRALPDDLINTVFCVDFIKRVEDEIHTCYSKATYPERVLNQVMQLNRAVCLDYPQLKVPWFQQNYIEAQISKRPVITNKMQYDLKRYIADLIKDERYLRCNHVTPYGYRIDFVIHFDRNKLPIAPPAETTLLDRITKVAILLLKIDSVCENSYNTMKGPELMRIRHLEMMGYKVVHINVNDWNSMYMNVPGAKEHYLRCLLQISN